MLADALPPVQYLTMLDQYALASLCYLGLAGTMHAKLGFLQASPLMMPRLWTRPRSACPHSERFPRVLQTADCGADGVCASYVVAGMRLTEDEVSVWLDEAIFLGVWSPYDLRSGIPPHFGKFFV